MKVTVTGASGLVGGSLVAKLLQRGDEVTVLTRDPDRARAKLGSDAPMAGGGQSVDASGSESMDASAALELVRWDLMSEPAPAQALAGRDAVVHLAGEPVAQRWSEQAKRAIRDSRVTGTHNLVEGLRALAAVDVHGDEGRRPARPNVLVSSSAIGYYGPHGVEPIDEEAPAGNDFLARVCAAWEAQARGVEQLGMRAVQIRTGVVLDRSGGALEQMLPPFRLGIGGPVAGGRQYVAWIHGDDLIGIMLAALDDERWSGPVNATAPEPVTNRELSRALGAALHRPALLPVPAMALRVLYGDMASIVTTGVRAVPAKALVLGYGFEHPRLDEALRAALG
jgi:uncharacterized protein